MTAPIRRFALVLGLGVLAGSVGCQSTGANSTSESGLGASATGSAREEGGMLLRTGSIMLGPGVGRNLWRWQGDGQGGF